MTQPVIENRIFVFMRNIFQKICDKYDIFGIYSLITI